MLPYHSWCRLWRDGRNLGSSCMTTSITLRMPRISAMHFLKVNTAASSSLVVLRAPWSLDISFVWIRWRRVKQSNFSPAHPLHLPSWSVPSKSAPDSLISRWLLIKLEPTWPFVNSPWSSFFMITNFGNRRSSGNPSLLRLQTESRHRE